MKKGLTLVELVAVLTILAIIALIVTPNIMVSVQEYQDQAYDTEIQAIAGAAKNWAADHISEIPSPETNYVKSALYLPISELVENGYFEEDVKDTKNGGSFDDDDHETFVIITCEFITDELGLVSDNYKYTYEAYTSNEEYVEKKALKYAKAKKLKTTSSSEEELEITESNLTDEEYIPHYIKKYGLEESFDPFDDINEIMLTITRTGKNEETYEYKYSVAIN